jgi:transposase
MSRKRRTFTREYKTEVVRQVHSGRSISEVSREIGVRTDTVRNWVEQAEGRAGLSMDRIGAAGAKRTEAEEEIRRLRRELEVVREERDFLKKAAAYFARDPK